MCKNSRAGFTLLELLIVLAITTIVLAAALPALNGLASSLKTYELDRTAEELFFYAQEQLSLCDIVSLPDARSLDDGLLCVLPDCDSHGLIPEKLSDGGTMLIIDPASAKVLCAYYSNALTSDELWSNYLQTGSKMRNPEIGHCTAYDDIFSPRKYRLVPNIEVINSDELWLKVTCDNVPHRPIGDYKVKVRLTGKLGSFDTSATHIFIEGNTLTAYCLIDRFTDGGSYYIDNLANYLGRTGDLTASVKISCSGFGETSDPDSEVNSVTFSPLFEDFSSKTVRVSTLRHLNNLRYLDGANGLTVIQTCDISCEFDIEPLPQFDGIFDARGHSISDLRLDGSHAESVGLFSILGGEVRNLSLTGAGTICEDCSIASSVGVICGTALPHSRILNCSVSGLSIEYSNMPENISIGSVAGICDGVILNCTSGVDISLSGGSAGRVLIGGIAGKLGGRIMRCHSAGKFECGAATDGAIIGGIAAEGDGSVLNCYTECSTGFIANAEYYGVCGPTLESESSFFLLENAWLDRESDCAVTSTVLRSSGFSCTDPVDPRGLVGIAKVEFSGSFSRELLFSFDAYGNESDFCPQIEWSSPDDGEARYYLIRSRCISDGWSFQASASARLGDPIFCGRYICQPILDLTDGEMLRLSFGGFIRETTVSIDEPTAEVMIGAMAVIHRGETVTFDPETWDLVVLPERFEYRYIYVDSDGTPKTYVTDQTDLLETLQPADQGIGEIRLYAFADAPLGEGWSFTLSGIDRSYYQSCNAGGIYYYELLRGGFTSQTVTLNRGEESVIVEFIYDAFNDDVLIIG